MLGAGRMGLLGGWACWPAMGPAREPLASRSEPARLGSLFWRARKLGSARLVLGSRAAPSRSEPEPSFKP